MERNIYNNEQRFSNWFNKAEKNGKIKGTNPKHSQLIISIIKDFRIGINVSPKSKKGARSCIRLDTIKNRLVFIFKRLELRGIKDITKVKPEQLHELFNDMREGVIKTKKGVPYKSTGDYVKSFKVFWHWFQLVKRKEGKIIDDITIDLDCRGEKPKFVYMTKEDVERVIEKASFDLKPVLLLALDSGARTKELMNLKISDFNNDFTELIIRDEISKTFGRKIKLMLSSNQIKEYVNKLGLRPDDFICQKLAPTINKELRKLGKKLLTPDQIKYKNLTLYDFRHSSACFWLPIYKSEAALKYRFGWIKSEMIHYYTEFLGMKDTITQDDMYVDITKTQLEKQIQEEQKKRNELEEKYNLIERRLKAIEIGLVTQATQQTSPVVIQTPIGQFDASISGTRWQDDRFKPREEYENGS